MSEIVDVAYKFGCGRYICGFDVLETVGGEVGLVISNPPYMKCTSGKRNESDEKYIARHEVCGSITDFCACATRLLKHGGKFVCVWRPDRLTDLLSAMHEHRLVFDCKEFG